jgi:hypothetical protein
MKITDIDISDYVVVRHTNVSHIEFIYKYWESVYDAGYLEDRLGDIKSPDLTDVYDMFKNMCDCIYYVWSFKYKMFIGEYMLENSYARSVQIHFSISPEVSGRDKIRVGIYVADMLLDYYDSVYGLTPMNNCAATKYIKVAGFEPKMVLKGGCYYRGEVVDALVSVKDKRIGNYK